MYSSFVCILARVNINLCALYVAVCEFPCEDIDSNLNLEREHSHLKCLQLRKKRSSTKAQKEVSVQF